MALPTLVLIGAPKCGTTSLFHWLAAHPDVAAGRRKEAQFLVDPGSSIFHPEANHRDHGLEAYASLFGAAHVVLDATPGYLYQRTALDVLANDLPDARLLVVVRDPVERFLSVHRYYTHNQPVLDVGVTPDDLLTRCLADDPTLPHNEFVRDAVTHGEYAAHLDRWAGACGRDRLLVLRSDDLRRSPHAALERVARFADLDPGPLLHQALEDHNVTYNVRNQTAQRVVARVRNAVPRGRLRNALARTYHRLNVTVAERSPADGVQRQLARHYAPWNERLHDQYGIDVESWIRP